MQKYNLKSPRKVTDNSLTAQIAREARRVERLSQAVTRETKRLRAARFRYQVLMKMANHAAKQPILPLPAKPKKVTRRDNDGPQVLKDIFKL